MTYLQNYFPTDWIDSLDQFCTDTIIKLTEVIEGSELWEKINSKFNDQQPNNNAKILSIQII